MRRNGNQQKSTSLQSNVSPDEMKRIRVSMELADAIKNVMSKRKLTKRQFADMMGTDQSEVKSWLSGTHTFNVATLFNIADCLGLL